MALQLMDGVSAAFNFQTDVNTTDVTAANNSTGSFPAASSSNQDSWKCIAGRLDLEISQELMDRTTFCTAGWKGRFAALKDMQGTLGGFMAKGVPIGNPSYMFTTSKGIPMLATFDTACTITANIMAARDSFGIVAQANTTRNMAWATDGTYLQPAFVWA